MGNGRPFFAKSTLGNIEIFAVIGIFTLYALEFAGISTFSQLVPDTGQAGLPALSFLTSEQEQLLINIGTVAIMAVVALIVVIYFAFLRKKIKVRR